jgi:hypothetical protein
MAERKLCWEKLSQKTGERARSEPLMAFRARVFGGWLVFGYGATGEEGAMTFVPDPEHKWDAEVD